MSFAWWKAGARLLGSGLARDVCGTGGARRALLLYRVATFRDLRQPIVHQNMGQSRELARALSERGYAVDVADFDERRRGLLSAPYDLVIDLHPRRDPLYTGRLAPGARRIAYITGSDPAASNAAERQRLADLERRRGVRLEPRRQVPPFEKEVLESFDGVLIFAGPFALSTYRGYALRSVHRLPNSGWDEVAVTDPARRDPRRFLFLASSGQVHKGLDLLLEVFAQAPELELVVCGPFRKERDFVRAYSRELFATPNIRAVGFVDVRSADFAELQSECGAMILPSCAEGLCGTVTVAMSFGLPSLVSAQCGFEASEVDLLADCRLETIAAATRAWAAQRPDALVERSRRARATLEERYRPAHYATTVRVALDAIPGAPAPEDTRAPGGDRVLGSATSDAGSVPDARGHAGATARGSADAATPTAGGARRAEPR